MGIKIRGTSLISLAVSLLMFSILILPLTTSGHPNSRQDDNQAPVAEILKPNNGDQYDVNEEITFDGSSSYDPDNDTLSYTWNFGDSETGSGKITTHSYAVPFVYVIRLTVSDGELNDTSQPVVIIVGGGGGQNQPPNAEITSPSNGQNFDVYETVYFDGASSTDPEEDPLSYHWDFGDDNSSDQPLTEHEYASTGSYRVTLTVNDGMYNDSARIVIFVDNNPPIADAGEDQETFAGQEIIFDGSNSTDPDPLGRIDNWTWNFDNGDMGYGEIVAYTYKQRNTYTVTLTVRDNDNATGSDSAVIAVYNAKPVAVLKVNPASSTIGEDVEFDASDSYDIDGFVGDYYFEFGDNFETGWISNRMITHSYTSTGIYDSTLKVRDNDKIESELVTVSVKITIEPSQPPTVSISQPSNEDHVSGELKIEGTASSADAEDLKIEIKIDNKAWQNVTFTNLIPGSDSIEAEWFHNWETESVEDGVHSIYARAFDGFQYSQEFKVDVNVVNEAVTKITLTLTLKPTQTQPQEMVEVAGKATYDTGVSVSDTNVDIEIKDQSVSWKTKTDSKGNYQREIQAPSDPGSYKIKVSITDGTLSDNTEKTLTVQAPPDMSVVEEDISFSKPKLILGDRIKINAKIHNLGDIEGSGSVEFYDADPEGLKGVLIKAMPVTVQPSGSTIVTISWIPKTHGEHSILVLIKDVTPTETNLENNQALKKIDVPAKPGEDEESDPFGGVFDSLEPLAEPVGGVVYFIGLIAAAIIVVIIVAVVIIKKRAKPDEKQEKPEDSRKPPPPASEERVVFTITDNN
jgi:PKD repeat protein